MKLRKVKQESNQQFDFIDRNLVTVTPDTSLANIVSLMSQEKNSLFPLQKRQNLQKLGTQPSYVLVQQGLQLVGLITEQDVAKLAVQQQNLQATVARDVMTKQVVTLQETEAQEILSLIQILQQYHIHHLPILNQRQEAVGMVTPRSIQGILKPTPILQSRVVAEVMKTDVLYEFPQTSVLQLARRMSTHAVRCVVIIQPHPTEPTPENPVSQENIKLSFPPSLPDTGCCHQCVSAVAIGMVTERDIVRCQALQMNLSELCAEMIMSSPLTVVSPTDSLWTADQKMQQQQVQHLVVVNHTGIWVGVISQSDILQVINSPAVQNEIDSLNPKIQVLLKDSLNGFNPMQPDSEQQPNSPEGKHQFHPFLAEEVQTQLEHHQQVEVAVEIAKTELQKQVQDSGMELQQNSFKWETSLEEIPKRHQGDVSEVCETLFVPLQETGAKIIATICMNRDLCDRQVLETQQADLKAKLHAFLDTAIETQSFAENLTETSQMQAQLKASQLLLAGVLNSSLDGIMAFKSLRDGSGKIVDFEGLFANPAACQLLGHSADSFMGKQLLEEVPGTVTEGLFDLYVQVVETGEPLEREFYSEFAQIQSWFQCIAVRLNDGFAVTFRDITRIKQSEHKLQHANEQLQSRVAELKQRNQEMELLSEMSDFLLACLTVEEAYRTLKPILRQLFPGCSGALYRTNPSNNLVEAFANWGDELHGQIMFHPKECWALRRGRFHWVDLEHTDLFCNHIDSKNPPAVSLCLPLIAQGETLGLLYLCSTTPHFLSEAKRQLARTVAEQISLAIANLKLRETLQNQSIRDPLTGLFNRRYLEEALDQEIPRAKRSCYSIGIIMLDVDHFKHFNDTFGHEAGDVVLQEVGKFLKRSVRESDIACRYGGEEMTLILPEATAEETFLRAEQIRQGIKQLLLQYRSHNLGSITASFGVASFPKHGLTANEVIQAADTALYQAKAAGRNCVKVAQIVDDFVDG